MKFAELVEGDFRMHAAAPEAPGGGHYAAVVVRDRSGQEAVGHEVFRDESLEDGKVWANADDAVAFALSVGIAAIQAQRVMREYRARC